MLDRLRPPKGAVKKRKRVGRGESSGQGKTSGKGNKGQKARSGGSVNPGFEGGQMPLQRRVPKRGFTNKFRVRTRVVNVGDLARMFSAGETVTPELLLTKGLIKGRKGPIKVLGDGEIAVALFVKANVFSGGAIQKIEQAGGRAEVI